MRNKINKFDRIKVKLDVLIEKYNLQKEMLELMDSETTINLSKGRYVYLSSISLTPNEFLDSLKYYNVDKDVFVKYHFKTLENAYDKLSLDNSLKLETIRFNLDIHDYDDLEINPFENKCGYISVLRLSGNNDKVFFKKFNVSKATTSANINGVLNKYLK